MKISVIIPVYNVEDYLPQCIESLTAQTYKNLEIILVNDGSTDKSGMICDSYAETDSRITVIHKDNGGLSSARNAGMDVLTGDFVSFVDSDDWLEPDLYSDFSLYIENNPECSIWQFCLTGIYHNREIPFLHGSECLLKDNEVRKAFIKQEPIWEYVCDKIWSTEVVRRFRFPVGKRNEDAQFNFECLFKTPKLTLKHTPKCYYNYRQERPGSITFGSNPEPFLEQLEGFKIIVESLEKEGSSFLEDAYAYAFQTVKRAMVGRFNQTKEKRKALPLFYPYLSWIKAKHRIKLNGSSSLKDWLFANLPKTYLYFQYITHK